MKGQSFGTRKNKVRSTRSYRHRSHSWLVLIILLAAAASLSQAQPKTVGSAAAYYNRGN